VADEFGGQDYPELTEKDLTPPESTQEPPEPEFEVDGKKILLSQIKEWEKGYLRQADYTRKSQQREREFEAKRKELEPLIQLADFLDANPEFADRMIKYLQTSGQISAEKKPEAGAVSNEYIQRLTALESTLAEIREENTAKQEQADDEALDAEIEQLKKKYPDFNEDAILEVAEKSFEEGKPILDLEAIYLKLNRDTIKEQLRKEIQKELQESAKRKVTVEASAGGAMRTPPKTMPKTYDEAAEAALEELL